jgi:protease-4
MLGKAGVTSDSIVLGNHAAMFSTAKPFSPDEWQVVDAWLDHIYADFTGKVAAGRGLTAERVHELARGRVWTGADAHERHLVDELGGVEEAADIARRRAGLASTAPVVTYPRLGPLDRVRPASNSEDRRAAAASARTADPAAQLAGLLAENWGPVWQLAARFGLDAGGPLMLSGSWTFR